MSTRWFSCRTRPDDRFGTFRISRTGSTVAPQTVSYTNAGFTGTVLSFAGTSDSTKDYAVKVATSGLASDTQYYYRFVIDATNETSRTGVFKTAPAADD